MQVPTGQSPSALLESLLDQRSDLWRGRARHQSLPAGVPTGFAALDAALTWGGWPPGSLSELLAKSPGVGLGLVLPALARLGCEGRWLLLVDPPWLPYAPALAAQGLRLERLVVVRAGEQRAWAAEQGLRSGACGAVLLWGGRWDGTALHRLQLAAETGGVLAFLFRDLAAGRHPSPVSLRLQVGPSGAGYGVRILKQRGGPAGTALDLPLPEARQALGVLPAATAA